VAFGDIEAAADKVTEILHKNQQVTKSTRDYMQIHLDFEKQVRTYAEVIISASKRQPLPFSQPEPSQNQKFVLAPWCYFDGEQLYHDFRGQFTKAGLLGDLAAGGGSFTKSDAERLGVTLVQWEAWVDATLIVPQYVVPEERRK
jgi:hypothetical protein